MKHHGFWAVESVRMLSKFRPIGLCCSLQ